MMMFMGLCTGKDPGKLREPKQTAGTAPRIASAMTAATSTRRNPASTASVKEQVVAADRKRDGVTEPLLGLLRYGSEKATHARLVDTLNRVELRRRRVLEAAAFVEQDLAADPPNRRGDG